MGYIGVGRAVGLKREDRVSSLHDEIESRRAEAREIFLQQARSLQDVASRIDDSFIRATRLLLRTEGHVVVLGLGSPASSAARSRRPSPPPGPPRSSSTPQRPSTATSA